MFFNNSFDDLDQFGEISENPAPLDLDKIKEELPGYSSQKLCEMIVCDRYLGFNEKLSLICMEELSSRRSKGDNFDFESYIDASMKDMPTLDFELPDLRSLLHQVIKK
jgi:hypothetical protein